jgi:hypothetical protein
VTGSYLECDFNFVVFAALTNNELCDLSWVFKSKASSFHGEVKLKAAVSVPARPTRIS